MTSSAAEGLADGSLLDRFQEAVVDDLRGLARLHDREPDRALLSSLRAVGFPGSLGLRLHSPSGREACQVMAQAIDALPDPLGDDDLDRLAVDFAEIYLNYGLRASPNESVWLDRDGLERQEPMFRVREAYRRHGLAVEDWQKRADDHLVLQLTFVAHLLEQTGERELLRETAAFLDEHLLRWVPQFATRVATRCATQFFAGLALLTSAYLDELRDVVAAVLEEPRPTPDEIEARGHPEATATPGGPTRYVPGVGPGW